MRKNIIGLTVLLMSLWLVLPVLAGQTDNSEQLSVLTNAVKTFTLASVEDATKSQQNAQVAFCTVDAGAINFTFDGTTPTTGSTGIGHQLAVGGWFKVTGHARILNFKAIGTSATSTLDCTYSFDNE